VKYITGIAAEHRYCYVLSSDEYPLCAQTHCVIADCWRWHPPIGYCCWVA